MRHASRLSFWILSAATALKRKRLDRVPRLGAPFVPHYHGHDLHTCFGCGPRNARGLRLAYHETDLGGVGCVWAPEAGMESFPNIVHGGISATMLDDLGGVAILHAHERFAVTVSAKFTWHSPAYLAKALHGHARVLMRLKRHVLVEGVLHDEKGRIVASMTGLYFIPSKALFQHLIKVQDFPASFVRYVGE